MKPFSVLFRQKMMQQPNNQTHIYSISLFTSVEQDLRNKLKEAVHRLSSADIDSRLKIIEKIVDMVISACSGNLDNPLFCEFSGLIIEYLLDFLLLPKPEKESDFYIFLSFLSHFPVTQDSPYYPYIHKLMNEQQDNGSERENLFNRLQLLYLITENGDFANAEELLEELEPFINSNCLELWSLLQLSKINIFFHQNKPAELLETQLNLILDTFQRDSNDSAVNFIIRWLITTKWHKQNIIKKTLLLRIYNSLAEQKSLNSAMVLYELFSLEERLVPAAEKIEYQRILIKYPAAVLNIQQLHTLYFFAGYYNCGVLSNFKDSIQDYQYSNYFLHKSWDSLLNLSHFMREHLDPSHYFKAIPYLEVRIKELSNQASLQNNAYIESLQANFYKIEELYEKVGELSLTDSLTGLRNRRYLEGNLFQMVVLAARHNVPVCFSMIDIDFFKLVNDNYGHLAGDYVLKELARILTSEFRKSDVIVRYGGDEFLVVLFDADQKLSSSLMEELRKKIETSSFTYQNQIITFTISIGIACDFHPSSQTKNLAKCIARADEACYVAKTTGRNKVELYQSKSKVPENNC